MTMTREDIVRVAREACAEAKRAGADLVDVTAHYGVHRGVNIEKDAIQRAETLENAWVSIRAIKNGAVGIGFTGGTIRESVLAAARDAADIAALVEPDRDFQTLPGPEEAEPEPESFDPRATELDTSEVVSWAVQAIDEVLSVNGPTHAVAGRAGCGYHRSFLVNSLGLEAWPAAQTTLHLDVRAVASKSADDVGSHEESSDARRLDDFHLEGIGRTAAEMAVRQTGAVKVESGELPVVLSPLACAGFLEHIARNAHGEMRRSRQTYFPDRTGEKIASDILTIRDDGLIPWGLSSGARDEEGSPRKRVTVIENGILKNWLHGHSTALHFNEPNTGHGSRHHRATTTNVAVELGSRPAAGIIGEIERGIYVVSGGLGAGPSGEIASPVGSGFLIENGELTNPIENTVLAGHIFDVLSGIDAISSDYREVPGRKMPTIRIRKMKVAGGK